jgi:transposase
MNSDKERINLTDKEAKFIKNNGKIDVNYSYQTAISEDGIIVSAYTSNCSSDRTETIKCVNTAELNTEENYKEILADSGYATFDNYEHLDKMDKIIYMPDQQLNTEAEKEQNPYHRNHFIYDKQEDCFICPENKKLPFYSNTIHKRHKQQSKVYKCKECPACDKQKLCVKGKYGEIHIEKREGLRQQIRDRLNSEAGKQSYLMRMRIESVFGNIMHNLNYVHLYPKGIKKNDSRMAINLYRAQSEENT